MDATKSFAYKLLQQESDIELNIRINYLNTTL